MRPDAVVVTLPSFFEHFSLLQGVEDLFSQQLILELCSDKQM